MAGNGVDRRGGWKGSERNGSEAGEWSKVCKRHSDLYNQNSILFVRRPARYT